MIKDPRTRLNVDLQSLQMQPISCVITHDITLTMCSLCTFGNILNCSDGTNSYGSTKVGCVGGKIRCNFFNL